MLSFTSHKVQNYAMQGEYSCAVTVPEVQALSIFLFCYPLYILVLLLCIATWLQGGCHSLTHHVLAPGIYARRKQIEQGKQGRVFLMTTIWFFYPGYRGPRGSFPSQSGPTSHLFLQRRLGRDLPALTLLASTLYLN